jgi:predicted HTH domain antitoxin
MIISIPDSVLEQSKISSQDLLVEIAAWLYQREIFSIGQARKLAGLDLISFQKELAKRQINIHYDIVDLEKDLKNLRLLS